MNHLARTGLVVWLALAGGGCAQSEGDFGVDDAGGSGPSKSWLTVVDVEPTEAAIGVRPALSVTFSDYIDDDSFKSYTFGVMRSGGINVSGVARYIMTDKTVVWRPNSTLEEGLTYRFALAGTVESATGVPLRPPSRPPTFEASRSADTGDPVVLPDVRWEAIEPIVSDKCARCHRDPQWGLNPLTYDSVRGAKSTEVDLYLVRPGDAADSYLMRKVLGDYPDIEFTAQPPPWAAGARPLSRRELLTIESWIAGGARR